MNKARNSVEILQLRLTLGEEYLYWTSASPDFLDTLVVYLALCSTTGFAQPARPVSKEAPRLFHQLIQLCLKV